MIDIDKWEARMTRRDDEPLLPPTPEEVLSLIAEIRRIQSILSDYHGTEKEVLMARVEKLERENRALGRMMGERKEHRKCPCGGGVIADSVGDNHHWIYCTKCMATTNEFETLEEAWAAWDGVE